MKFKNGCKVILTVDKYIKGKLIALSGTVVNVVHFDGGLFDGMSIIELPEPHIYGNCKLSCFEWDLEKL